MLVLSEIPCDVSGRSYGRFECVPCIWNAIMLINYLFYPEHFEPPLVIYPEGTNGIYCVPTLPVVIELAFMFLNEL